MLGWSLYFKTAIKTGWFSKFRCSVSPTSYLGISRFLTIFEENWLKRCATSDSLETNSSFSTKVIFSLDFNFSGRKGLTVWQNFLLSMISFSLRLANYSKRYTSVSLFCVWNVVVFGRSFKNLFLNLVLCIIAWDEVLFINGSYWDKSLRLSSGLRR